MCHYQTLYHHEQAGYIVRCKECEKIQLAYGNLMVTFCQDEFDAFHNWLQQIYMEQPAIENPTLRCIIVPTPCDGMKWLLSLRELNELAGMLEAADTELKSLSLLSLFDSSQS